MRALKQATHTRRTGGIILFWCILKSAECFGPNIMAYYSTCVNERQDCLNKLFGMYPVCSDCTQFALCDPNTRLGIIKINCPIYLFYDIRTGSCVLPELAICGSSNQGRLLSPNSAPALNSASRPPAARRPASQERATYQSSTSSLPSQDSDEGVDSLKTTNIMERPLYSTNTKYATSLLRKSISANPTSLINPLKSPEKTTFSMTPTDPSGVDTSTYPTFATSPEIAGRDYSVRNSKVSGDVSGPGDKTNNARYENYLKDRFDKESNDTTPNDDSLNYRHKYGQGKIAKDSEETFNDYFVNNYPDKSPVSLSNPLSLNSNTDIPHSTKATQSRTNDPIAVAPSPISTLTTTASIIFATPTTIAATAPSIVTATTPTTTTTTSTTTTHFIERGKCLASCKGVPDGDYQSCFSCHFYITCSNGFLWDNRPCPSNLVWDDLLQMCVHVSTTCHVQVIRR